MEGHDPSSTEAAQSRAVDPRGRRKDVEGHSGWKARRGAAAQRQTNCSSREYGC